jgi:molecular chaperone GrpE
MRPFAPQPVRRFYSTENNGEKKEAAQEGESAENAEEDPVRKELEEKKKEVTELKVCRAFYSNDCFFRSLPRAFHTHNA